MASQPDLDDSQEDQDDILSCARLRIEGTCTMRVFAACCVCFIVAGTASAAFADGFPGKGDPGDWEDALPYYNRANRYLNQGRYDDAIEDYKVAIGKYKYDADFYTNLGVAYRKQEDYGSAAECYKRASELNPKDWVPVSDLANAYLKQNKLQETVATFQRTLKLNPPAAEKAHILQDIKDINKILRMQGGAPATAAKPTATPSTANRKGPATASDPNRRGDAMHRPDLKSSGWDYVYK